jgi:hypothetical protein
VVKLKVLSAQRRSKSSNGNIGYPKLFTVGVVGRRIPPAAPAVNNFAAARAARDFGWHLWII